MPINVSPATGKESTHHLKLTDSSATELGLICVDANGDRISRVAVNPYPRFASQLRQGRAKHADRQPPFEDIAQSDFSGGLASLHFDEDESKYLDGKRIDTSRMGEVIHGGLETYMTGIRDFDESWPGNVDWLSLDFAGANRTTTFVAGASYNVNSIVVILKKVGAPTGNITVLLLASGGSVLKSKVLTVGTDLLTDLVSERVEFVFDSVQAITATTTYKVKVVYSGSSSDYVDVAIESGGDLYYRVLDDAATFKILPFEYYGALYGITQPDDMSVSKLYLLGYRGVADANTGALTTLVDAAGGFAANEIELVTLVGGTGLAEEQPWRTASSNTGTAITVSPTWNIEHDTTTEYVAISNRWQLLQTFDKYVTDVTVVGRHVFFAFGSAQKYKRYRVYNAAGTFTEELSAVGHTELSKVLAYKIEIDNEDVKGGEFFGYYADPGTPRRRLYRYSIPYLPGDLFNDNGIVVPAGTLFDETAIANTIHYGFNGMSAIQVAAGFTTGDVGHVTIDSTDFRKGEYLGFYAWSSVALAAGDWEIGYADSEANRINLDIPALAVDTWTWVVIQLVPDPSKTGGSVDESDITDIYFQQDVDKGAMDFFIRNGFGIHLIGDGFDTEQKFYLPDFAKVNNLIAYIGGSGQTAAKPWIITTEGLFYREGNTIVPVVLDEMKELSHPRTGEGATVNDVYLYFNLGETIQRYYAGHLDSVGPDVDYGLPANRRGIPASMASYPGKVLVGIDAGASGYSSVLYRRNHGWHELYRGVANKRIRSIHVVGYTGVPDRVFISEGSDVLSVPVSINPETESGYKYTYESALETSRIYGGLRETEKYYHALTIISENLSTTNRYIQVDFRTSENSTYAPISTNFISSPRQRQSLVSTNDTAGRWIQFRLRSYTNDRTETPKIVSVILDTLERLDVNNMYQYSIELKEGVGKMLGNFGEDNETGVEKLTQLETWVDDPKPLTLNTTSGFEDGKLVFLEGITKRVIYHNVDDKPQELRVADLTLIEVS